MQVKQGRVNTFYEHYAKQLSSRTLQKAVSRKSFIREDDHLDNMGFQNVAFLT